MAKRPSEATRSRGTGEGPWAEPLERTDMSEGGPAPDRPENDIYTILLAVASLFMLIAVVFISVRSQQLFESWLPFGGVPVGGA